MLLCRQRGLNHSRRRGAVVVLVALFMAVMLGFAALTVDVGMLYNTRGDLQRTADAAALAAAARLGEFQHGDPQELARQSALEFTERNDVFGRGMTIDAQSDVVFGRAVLNAGTGQYDFIPSNNLPDAVRVRVRHTHDSPNGAVPLLFARIFGKEHSELSADAIAIMVPRDIAIVADLSGSHNDDSELKHYKKTQINLHDVWAALPGGAGEIGSTWELDELPDTWVDEQGSSTQAAGPGWGYFKKMGWGTENVDSSYWPDRDPGTVRLPYNSTWFDSNLRSHLADQGYSSEEVSAIMSSNFDGNGAYPYRVAVAMGLAFWNSGKPGGLWEQRGVPASQAGDGSSRVRENNLEWTEAIMSLSVAESAPIWVDYIDNYVRRTNNMMYAANASFRYQYGIKTFVNYLLERRAIHEHTPEFAQAPTQPMKAVKDAVQYLTSMVHDLETDDQLSLAVYGTTARHEVDLTHNHMLVSTRLNAMQAGHYDTFTNMGGGMERGIEELTSVRARSGSRKIIILLTDGIANVGADGSYGSNENAFAAGAAYAVAQAERAEELGIRIFAVSVGSEANQSLMEQIADIGQGEHFFADGSIEEYSAQLADIFGRLGSKRSVELIR